MMPAPLGVLTAMNDEPLLVQMKGRSEPCADGLGHIAFNSFDRIFRAHSHSKTHKRLKAAMRIVGHVKKLVSVTRAMVCIAALVTAPIANAGASLYEDLGSGPGVARLVDVFVIRLYADPLIGPFFDGVDPAGARRALQAQFCDEAGGPCKTIHPDMKKAHAAMDVTKGDFDTVLMLLRQSMDELSIAPDVQQRLLQTLKPMEKDIVNTP